MYRVLVLPLLPLLPPTTRDPCATNLSEHPPYQGPTAPVHQCAVTNKEPAVQEQDREVSGSVVDGVPTRILGPLAICWRDGRAAAKWTMLEAVGPDLLSENGAAAAEVAV